MQINIIRDSEKAIIGFNLATGCHIDEDFFVANLPTNHEKGDVRISIISNEISIVNGADGTRSLKIPLDKIMPEELIILRSYIESKETQIEIKHEGNFRLFSQVYFINERVKKESMAVS